MLDLWGQKMKKTDQEKELFELFRKMESQKSKRDLLFHAETMVRAQEALREDYGLVGLDAPLFNSAGGKPAA